MTTPPPGLREHLAARAERASALTSPQRVLDRVDRRLHAPRRNSRLVVVAVAAVVAASLCGALLLPKLGHRAPAPAQPNAPHTGSPLVWVGGPVAGQLSAYDWTGRRVGMLRIPTTLRQMLTAPDGRTIVIAPQQGRPYLMDSSGSVIGTYSGLKAPHWKQLANQGFWTYRAVFSSDDRTLCVEGGDAYDHPMLHVLRPDGSDRAVLDIGPGPVVEPAWRVLACDAAGDRAVLSLGGARPPGVRAILRVIQLSTGRELSRHVIPTSDGQTSWTLSADGHWLGEALPSGETVIYDLNSNAVVGHVPGVVTTILAGGRRVLMQGVVAKEPDTQTLYTIRIRVVDVASGATLWHLDIPGRIIDNVDPTSAPSTALAYMATYDNGTGPLPHCGGTLYTLVDASKPVVTGESVRICY